MFGVWRTRDGDQLHGDGAFQFERLYVRVTPWRVVLIASAGNGGKETAVFPGAFRNVIGVGSTDYEDRRSAFSNYGRGLVRVSAPGERLVTLFPGNHYALVSGTSFSTAPYRANASVGSSGRSIR